MRRLLSIVLCLVITLSVFSIIPTQASTTYTYGDLTYEITDNDTITITGCDSFAYSVDIPSYIDGYPVTSIGEFAFRDNKIRYVTIPNTVKSIEQYAFDGCMHLINVSIPSSVVYIGFHAFAGSTIETIVIPGSVRTIEASAFAYSHLRTVIIEDGLTSLISIFSYCYDLSYISIPKSVTSIVDGIFITCKDVTIYGYKGSKAESYANKNKLPFEIISDYYLVGSINGKDCWSLDKTDKTSKFVLNDFANDEEYMLNCYFSKNDAIKVVAVQDGEIVQWYNDIYDDNYIINEEGNYTIYFRPQGNSDWKYSYIYTEKKEEAYVDKSFDMSYIKFKKTKYDLTYPIYNETDFAKELEVWIKQSPYFKSFNKYISAGVTYKELLHFTIDTPLLSDDGYLVSVQSDIEVKDAMAYIIFAYLAQDFINEKIKAVKSYFIKKDIKAYTDFLDAVQEFNTQYINFQDELNKKNAFNNTLMSLWFSSLLIDNIKGLVPSVGYMNDIYKTKIVESPKYYDDLSYYVASGGDDSYLSSDMKYRLKDMNLINQALKDVHIGVKNMVTGNRTNILGANNYIQFTSDKSKVFKVTNGAYSIIKYLYKNYGYDILDNHLEGDAKAKNKKIKKAMGYFNDAKDIVSFVNSGHFLGLVGGVWSLTDKYISEVTKIYDSFRDIEAGWYALTYYYMGLKKPGELYCMINPNTGDAGAEAYGGSATEALFNAPSFNYDDVIEKQIAYYYEKNIILGGHTYSPKQETKLYLLNACNTMTQISKLDIIEQRENLTNYILSEINLSCGLHATPGEVTLTCNNKLGKTIQYELTQTGQGMTVKAVPNNDATFVGWKDITTNTIVSKSEEYSFTVFGDKNLEAIFVENNVNSPSIPIIKNLSSDSEYYCGEKTSLLSIELDYDGNDYNISWYMVSEDNDNNPILIGNSCTPSSDKEGTYYYYARVNYGTSSGIKDLYIQTDPIKITINRKRIIDFSVKLLDNSKKYLCNGDFDINSVQLMLTYSNGEEEVISPDNFIITYDFSKEGVSEVKFNLHNIEKSIFVNVYSEINGSFSNGIKWTIKNHTLSISGKGNLPSNEKSMFDDYIYYINKIVIGDGIVSIEGETLNGLVNINEIKFPVSLTKIESNSFNGLDNVKRVVFPKNLEYIGKEAFSKCTNLEAVEIIGNNTDIKENAFSECPKLTIYAHVNSYAQTYANNNHITFANIVKLMGDANNDWVVTIADATTIQRYLAVLIDESQICLENASITSDRVSIVDVTRIQSFLALLISEL